MRGGTFEAAWVERWSNAGPIGEDVEDGVRCLREKKIRSLNRRLDGF